MIGGGAAAVIAVCVGLSGWLRVRDAAQLSQPNQVQTDGGTNYVVQVVETTIGKTESGYLLLVTARFENPNPYEVALRRDWFVLVDHNKDYYQPSTTGTQTALIKLAPNGVLEKETLNFVAPESVLVGAIELKVGKDRWVMIKDDKPVERQLKSGEFVSFRRRTW
jgi:hypothetical protein